MFRISGEVSLSVQRIVEKELRRHLSNFVSDLDKIGKIIEDLKPHHGVVRRWRMLKFEMEGNVNDVLTLINAEKTDKTLSLARGRIRKNHEGHSNLHV